MLDTTPMRPGSLEAAGRGRRRVPSPAAPPVYFLCNQAAGPLLNCVGRRPRWRSKRQAVVVGGAPTGGPKPPNQPDPLIRPFNRNHAGTRAVESRRSCRFLQAAGTGSPLVAPRGGPTLLGVGVGQAIGQLHCISRSPYAPPRRGVDHS